MACVLTHHVADLVVERQHLVFVICAKKIISSSSSINTENACIQCVAWAIRLTMVSGSSGSGVVAGYSAALSAMRGLASVPIGCLTMMKTWAG